MQELSSLLDQLHEQRPASWDQLPDFALYMDQVLSYMDRQVIRFDETDGLTAAMVNNYTKSGLVPRAKGKKYDRDHLAYLTVICILKHVMSTKDMDFLIREELQGERGIPASYTAFCESLDTALNIMADEVVAREENNIPPEDSAIRFALLSYAAGAVSNRYVAQLRAKKEAEQPAPAKKSKKETIKDA